MRERESGAEEEEESFRVLQRNGRHFESHCGRAGGCAGEEPSSCAQKERFVGVCNQATPTDAPRTGPYIFALP